MKVTLDLTRLVEEGKITPAESVRLQQLAAQDTGSLGINILVGFGVVAVSAGLVALVPTPASSIVVGLAVFALGAGMTVTGAQQWSLLAQICTVAGALIAGAGVMILGEGSLVALLLVTAGFAIAAVIARNSLLTAAAVLALAACFGARAGYWHASYALAIYEPAVTVVLFSALALGAYHLSKRLASDFQRLAITVARTSVFLVNFGFWIGSLWGDRLLLLRSLAGDDPRSLGGGTTIIPDWIFAVTWALALAGVGLWGVQANRRWVVNIAAVFGAIHFYTQWFERLGASPPSVLLGGLILLAVAFALWRFNHPGGTGAGTASASTR